MCRYAVYGPYKEHYACFSCRKMFRRPSRSHLAHPPAADLPEAAPCPQCGAAMRNLGKDFKAPRQRDVQQWRKVELLYRNGYTFHSCGCSGPGPRPETLHEVQPFLKEQLLLEQEHERRQRLASEEYERAKRRKRAAAARRSKLIVRQRRTAI